MRKWEEKYEKLKNGDFDARIDELKSKVDNRAATKEELKEFQSLEKGKSNIQKIGNVVKYKKENENILEDIKKELQAREDMVKANQETLSLEVELIKLQEELESVNKELKVKPEEEKAELKAKKADLIEKINENGSKFAANQAILNGELKRDGKFKSYDEVELKEIEQKAKSTISKCNMVANSLVKGLSWDSIDLKLDNWKGKRFTKKDNSKEENKKGTNEEIKEIRKEVEKETKDEKENEEINKDGLKKKLDKRTKFEAKHPRLAKIANWFRKITKKDNLLPEPETKPQTKESKDDFKEYIKFVAEYGHENARKEQIKNNKELRAKLDAMREANRQAEDKKFGEGYSAESRRLHNDEGR